MYARVKSLKSIRISMIIINIFTETNVKWIVFWKNGTKMKQKNYGWPFHGIMQNWKYSVKEKKERINLWVVTKGEKNKWMSKYMDKPSSSALNDIKNKRAQNKHPIDMKYSNIFKRGNTKFLLSTKKRKNISMKYFDKLDWARVIYCTCVI